MRIKSDVFFDDEESVVTTIRRIWDDNPDTLTLELGRKLTIFLNRKQLNEIYSGIAEHLSEQEAAALADWDSHIEAQV
jgi:hypothetical protein